MPILPILVGVGLVAYLINLATRDDDGSSIPVRDVATSGTVLLEPGEHYRVTLEADNRNALLTTQSILKSAGAADFGITAEGGIFRMTTRLRLADSLEVDLPMQLPGAPTGVRIVAIEHLAD